ncbi:MAG TPA: YIP1 family protein [Rhodanobacteraceae bacterium]|nr:YIP1 family protein [Rhodanobacteraceae bacterium]
MNLLAFLASTRDLCLFRRGPEDMPYSPQLLVGLLVASALFASLFDVQLRDARVAVVLASVLGTLATLYVLYGLLRLRGKAERFVQTALALVATSFLFELIAMPLLLLVPLPAAGTQTLKPGDVSGAQMLAAFAVFAFAIWQVCISVSILRRGMDVPVAGGVLVLLLLACTNFIVAAVCSYLFGMA